MKHFRIIGEKATVHNGVTAYRVACEDAEKNVFYCRSNTSVAGMQGGYCSKVEPEGTELNINGQAVKLTRATGFDAYFSTTQNVVASKGYLAALAAE